MHIYHLSAGRIDLGVLGPGWGSFFDFVAIIETINFVHQFVPRLLSLGLNTQLDDIVYQIFMDPENKLQKTAPSKSMLVNRLVKRVDQLTFLLQQAGEGEAAQICSAFVANKPGFKNLTRPREEVLEELRELMENLKDDPRIFLLLELLDQSITLSNKKVKELSQDLEFKTEEQEKAQAQAQAEAEADAQPVPVVKPILTPIEIKLKKPQFKPDETAEQRYVRRKKEIEDVIFEMALQLSKRPDDVFNLSMAYKAYKMTPKERADWFASDNQWKPYRTFYAYMHKLSSHQAKAEVELGFQI